MKKTFALSLPEALVTLMLVAVVAVASVPLILKKYNKDDKINHGIWECRLDASGHTVTKRRRNGTIISGPTQVGNFCKFIPPANATDFQIDICGTGRDYECNFNDGTHVLQVYPTLNKSVKVQITGTKIYFGDYAFAYTKDAGARVIIVY